MHAVRPDILDCTLRDGGYYTLWDFSDELVSQYLSAVSQLPVQIVEIGYINPPKDGYYGRYFYLSPDQTTWARSFLAPSQLLAVMLDEKSIDPSRVQSLLAPHVGIVDVVRIAVAPSRLAQASGLTALLKEMGFQVGVNVMYLSKYADDIGAVAGIADVANLADSVALVDSYGACSPAQVKNAVAQLRAQAHDAVIGFHGHDNLGLAVANSLAAIDAGATVIDGTMTGMGRGPGNTRLETMLVQQAHLYEAEIDYAALASAVGAFDELFELYRWGTNLIYMISGAAGLPQNNVMDWIGKNRYSVPAIIEALRGEGANASPLQSVPVPTLEPELVETVLIIGGGATVSEHSEAIVHFANSPGCVTVHASARHLELANRISRRQLFALAGDAPALGAVARVRDRISAFLVPAAPRFSIDIDEVEVGKMREVAPFEIDAPETRLGPVSDIAPLSLALGAARAVQAANVILVGFDGYVHASTAQQELARETQELVDAFRDAHPQVNMRSATRTAYKMPVRSIYAESLVLQSMVES